MQLKSDGYIVQDYEGYAIYGIGSTEDEAWADTVDNVGTFFDDYGNTITAQEARDTQFTIYPATAALLDQVDAEGGAITWGNVDGIACTGKEEDDNV